MGYGDEIMAAGHARVVFEASDRTRLIAICDKGGAIREHELWKGNPIIATREDALTRRVLRIHNGVGCRPYIRYPFTSERGLRPSGWRARDHRGEIFLTNQEYHFGSQCREAYGPYVVIEPCAKRLGNVNKTWGFEKYQAVVNQNPNITFLQPGYDGCRVLTGALEVKTETFRDACGLLSHAQLYIGPEGGLHHASAALSIKAIVIFGGYISPDITGYPEHINLVGDPEPCGRWKPCGHCHEAMARITPEQVTEHLRAALGAP